MPFLLADPTYAADLAQLVSVPSACAPYPPVIEPFARRLRALSSASSSSTELLLQSGVELVAYRGAFFLDDVQDVLSFNCNANIRDKVRALEDQAQPSSSQAGSGGSSRSWAGEAAAATTSAGAELELVWPTIVDALLKTGDYTHFAPRCWKLLCRLALNRGRPTLWAQFERVIAALRALKVPESAAGPGAGGGGGGGGGGGHSARRHRRAQSRASGSGSVGGSGGSIGSLSAIDLLEGDGSADADANGGADGEGDENDQDNDNEPSAYDSGHGYGHHRVLLPLEKVFLISQLAESAVQTVETEMTRAQVQAIIDRVLAEDEPVTWEGGMKGARTAAYFLKYIETEDAQLCFDGFAQENERTRAAGEQPNFTHLLESARKRYFGRSGSSGGGGGGGGGSGAELVKVSDLLGSSDAEFGRMLARKFDVELPAERDPVWREVQRLCLTWTKARLEAQVGEGVPLSESTKTVKFVPHHTQVVCLLMMVEFYHSIKQSNKGGGCRSYVAEIGTGEGKSVVIALLAAYLALQGLKVHVLVNNRTLLKRDYNSNRRFFAALGLSSAEGMGAPAPPPAPASGAQGAHSRSHSRHSAADSAAGNTNGGGRSSDGVHVRYLVMSDVANLWRESVHQRQQTNPFAGHALVVDEVDELIVDEIPLLCHTCSFPHLNDQLRASYDALLAADRRSAGVSAGELRPESVTDNLVWQNALEARAEAARMVEGEQYVLEDGRYWKREEKSIKKAKEPRWLDYLNYRDFGGGSGGRRSSSGGGSTFALRYSDAFYTQSIPHMINSYARLFGLTGTVGGQPEREHLRREYAAEVTKVPRFLHTCRGFDGSKQLVRTECIVEQGEAAQFAKIASLALAKRRQVPVLVVCQNPRQVSRLQKAMLAAHGSDGTLRGDELQVLLEHEGDVNDVTQRSESGRELYRITVTDYFGGRGHDFICIDNKIDAAGGMMLILTQIPESQREWVQWLGRTARQDKKGQWALVLNSADEPQCDMGKEGALVAGKEDAFIQACFRKRNEDMARRVKARKQLADEGKVVNQFCDLYYAEKGLTDQSRWPMFQFLREHEHRGQYPTPSRRAMESFLGRRLPAA
eukprot:g1407.t1